MKIHVLPGIAPKTEAWSRKLLQELALPASETTIQHYLHWDCAGDSCLKAAEEIARLEDSQVDLLIGLSLGTMLGLSACSKGIISPKRVVCIGVPVTAFQEENLDLPALAAAMAMPVLYIQQKDDVVGSAAQLRQAVGAKARLIDIPGNNHQYKDLQLLSRHISRWLAE